MKATVPVGMRFMEPVTDSRVDGGYDPEKHMWVDKSGQPALLSSATATGSNASTGAASETDYNEDFD